MNPQLLRAIAVERMDEIAREAEHRRRMSGASQSSAVAKQNGRHNAHRLSVRASIRRLQPGS